MAFNFNWSPMAADASLYDRTKNLLTAALNKYPKPPIIVDDILVNELNLGSVPPDLDILEIGDLAEDRFRGIFKMCYTGDAFLTLKTRVQANPLSTYLSTTPSFTSPQPLAASSGLTIPLQISLSDIRLSAFIILVFSRQKGLTLVFRNDPLESLKVSSTFDSIPFVRDYLQKEIEGQLRTLLMDEVPAIIHRLSLQWIPEYGGREEQEKINRTEVHIENEHIIDPLAFPPEDAVDSSGRPLDASQIASLTSDSSAESHALFSQKTLLKLAALNDSHRTLSLFTPGMKDVVFRAWTGPMEQGDRPGSTTPRIPLLNAVFRNHPYGLGMNTVHSHFEFPEKVGVSRPTLSTYGSTSSSLQLGRHAKPGRRRKHRVVNLRRTKTSVDGDGSVSGGSSISAPTSTPGSEAAFPIPSSSIPEERDGDLSTPPSSPNPDPSLRETLEKQRRDETGPSKDLNVTLRHSATVQDKWGGSTNTRTYPPLNFEPSKSLKEPQPRPGRPPTRSTPYFSSYQYPLDNISRPSPPSSTSATQLLPYTDPSPILSPSFLSLESSPGGILEQAWMMELAGAIARRVQEGKVTSDLGLQEMNPNRREETPPPAYGT